MTWYTEWAAKHSIAFALPEKAIEMFVGLEPVWTTHFTRDELFAATRELVFDNRKDKDGNNRLKWHEEHRTAVPEAIKNLRGKAKTKHEQSQYRDDQTCQACGNTGLATVPHPGKKEGGKFPLPLADELTAEPNSINRFGTPIYRGLSVACWCGIGAQITQRQHDSKHKIMTIQEYENRYPNWRDVQFQIDGARQAARATRTVAEVAESERSLRELIRSIQANARQHRT